TRAKIKLSNAVIRWISRVRLEGVTGFNHHAGTGFGFDPGDEAIDFAGSKLTKLGAQCMPAVGVNCNKLQDWLARNHSRSLKLLGVEAFNQVPPIRCRGRCG